MATKRATVILAFSAALALAAQPALAQHGGHGGGGGHSGGGAGRAVPRGSGGGYHPGGGAQARHPQAGTGSYYHGYHGGYYGGHYGHYPYYGGHYGYGYYPYYGHSSFYFGLSFGWPYYYGGWYPYASPAYGYYPGYYPPYYGYGYDSPQGPPPGQGESGRPYGSDRTCSALRANGGDTGRVRLEVRPDDASVYVDDEFCGNAQEARFLTLAPGRHSIELVRPGFEVARREADVVTAQTVDVLVELQQRSY